MMTSVAVTIFLIALAACILLGALLFLLVR